MEATSTPDLRLRPISDLLSERFVIPPFQRGYRWARRQVRELLNDLDEFERAKPSDDPQQEFYCLQPVVVRPRPDGGEWEVIDGQQRLTTILLVLNALSPLMAALDKSPYSLEYDTRPGSASFLRNPIEEAHTDNVDYFHLFEARTEIDAWLEGRPGPRRLDFLQRILHPTDRNVRVIWYELPEGANPIDVFVRLNVGKIRLTNAELIRALFLRRLNFAGTGEGAALASQHQIAQEWDALEKKLQDERFWHFVHDGPSPYPARIEYLFAIKVEADRFQTDVDDDGLHQDDDYGTFLAFQRSFAKGGGALEQWREIRWLALRLEEWFEDRVLYHLVGFIVATSGRPSAEVVVELLHRRQSSTRSEFERFLRGRIFEFFASKGRTSPPPLPTQTIDKIEGIVRERLDDLDYSGGTDQKRRLRSALLLFNVASLLRNTGSDRRFPFDLFRLQPWDIEHIRSVKSDQPLRPEDMRRWLERVLEYWEGDRDGASDGPAGSGSPAAARSDADEPPPAEPAAIAPTVAERDNLREEVRAMLANLESEPFKVLYERILGHFQESATTETEHGIQNLALLDEHTNRSYKNAVFPVKRLRILELDKSGTYVPLCTTNAFLKYYSRTVDQMMFWRKDDEVAYFEAMVDMLTHLFAEAVR